MRLESIRIFLEVIEQGSVRQAAERVHITPSAVSRHIATLETLVGASLFDRKPPGMVLTEQGLILEKYARRIASNLDLVKAAVAEIKGLRRGVVRVFAIEAVATSIIHPAIREFSSMRAGIRFEIDVVSKDNAEVTHALLGGVADLGIMYKLNINAEIDYAAEFLTPFGVIARPDHPLAQRSSIHLAELAGTPLAMLAPSSATRKLIDGVVRAGGIELDYALTANSFEMAKEFAGTGYGVCILPAIAVERERLRGELTSIPLADLSLRSVRTAICTKKGQSVSPLVQDFLGIVRRRSANVRNATVVAV